MQAQQEICKPYDRTRRPAVRGRNGFRQAVIGPVRERITVDRQQRPVKGTDAVHNLLTRRSGVAGQLSSRAACPSSCPRTGASGSPEYSQTPAARHRWALVFPPQTASTAPQSPPGSAPPSRGQERPPCAGGRTPTTWKKEGR